MKTHKEGRQLISIYQLGENFVKPCKDHKIVDWKNGILHTQQQTQWPEVLLTISCHVYQQKPYTNPHDELPKGERPIQTLRCLLNYRITE